MKASPLDRFLRLIADVHAGEGITALLLASNVFLLLTCYYILRVIREGLILSEFSPEVKSYTTAAQVVVLAAVVPLYGMFADRVPRRRLINVVTYIFAGCLIVFFFAGQAGVAIGIVYYIWLSIFSVMIIAQFWAFANDIYVKEEGERLFPIVALGQSLGPVLGGAMAAVLIAPLGTYELMLVSAGLLIAQVQVTNYVDRRERLSKEADLPPKETTAIRTATSVISLAEIHDRLAAFQGAEDVPFDAFVEDTPGEKKAEPTESDGGTGAFALVFKTRYLLLIGLLMMILNFVNTNGGYVLDRVVFEGTARAVAAGETGGLSELDFISRFYAGFNLWVAIVGAVIQLFFVSRIVKYFGVAVGIIVLPLVSLGAYSLIAFYPVLEYIRWAKTGENATDYSLNNTVRNMLFLPTTREQKYKAKQTIDSFFVRVGDLGSTALVAASSIALGLSTAAFAKINIVAVLLWLALAFLIGREYKRFVASGETPSPS